MTQRTCAMGKVGMQKWSAVEICWDKIGSKKGRAAPHQLIKQGGQSAAH